MVEPRFRWALPTPVDVSPAVHAAGLELGLGRHALGLLALRGVADPDALGAFFAPAADGLHDPRLLPDAERFLDRIGRARAGGERVLVFGDFDADGLTGLTVLTRALRRTGIEAIPYVPHRVDEGHGLSQGGIQAAVDAGATLIVTVDCGSTSVAEVDAAAARGIEVIVSDHHRVPEEAPRAVAIVNPHRPDATYPDRRLTGAGLAFKLAALLLDRPGGHDDLAELAALAAVGTVADVAPVLGENRSIARLGLEAIRAGRSAGIAALLRRAGTEPASVDLETIGFVIAPRLNAASRVGEAADAAALLLTDDPAEADRLADLLEAANLERRDLTRTAVAEARATIPEGHAEPATVIRGDWPVGIVGLVAARLAEEHGRAAVVGSNLGSIVRASCRSDGRLDLAATLRACDDLLLRYGGHRGAAGFEIAADRWDAFRDRFLALAAEAVPADPRVSLSLDLVVDAEAVDYALLRDLARLAPFGPGHPDPLLAITGLTATRVRPATGGHTQFTLRRRLDVLDGIAFGRADLADTVQAGSQIDIVARLSSRRFGGFESLQLDIRDAAGVGHIAGLTAEQAARPLVAVGPGPGAVVAAR
ncbi:MAG: single-stranded-DNA-specific exonuclease RecJ [Chloroflexota bacterium]